MVRIQQDVPLYKVLDTILIDGYAAVPPTNYKKRLRIQILNTAMKDEGFCNEFERVIEEEISRFPRLDEIDDLIDEMPQSLKDILEQYGIIETAKTVAKEDSTWCGHEMTPNQKELCETVWESVSDWYKELPEGCDISLNMEDTYEYETGKSCVNWRNAEDWGLRDTLPRSEEYTTEGHTQEFENWAIDIIVKAVVEAGCETQLEVADFIRKKCPVVQG